MSADDYSPTDHYYTLGLAPLVGLFYIFFASLGQNRATLTWKEEKIALPGEQDAPRIDGRRMKGWQSC